MTATHEQDASQSQKTMEEVELFNKHYQVFYRNLICRDIISVYDGTNMLAVLRQPSRCTPLGFNIGGKAIGGIDQNKAYSTLLTYDLTHFPRFDQSCNFVQCSGEYGGNAEWLDDYAMYIVKTVEGYNYTIPQRLILDKRVCLYYGTILKRAIAMLGELPFFVWAKCSPVSVIHKDFSEHVKNLYNDTTVPTSIKKKVVNCALGNIDKFIVSKRYCEWHSDAENANSILGITPNGRRIEIELKENGTNPDRTAMFTEATDDDSINEWMTQHDEYHQSLDSIYLNVGRVVEHRLSEGFLPISQLKYMLQRLRVLASWQNVERSNTLEPIGVKVDCVFVKRKAVPKKKRNKSKRR